MDIDRCAHVILSGAGRQAGHLVDDDPVRMAAAIVGRDAVVPAAHALADGWLRSGGTVIGADDEILARGARVVGWIRTTTAVGERFAARGPVGDGLGRRVPAVHRLRP